MPVGRLPFVYQPLMAHGAPRGTQIREMNPGSPEYRHTQESGEGSRQFYVKPGGRTGDTTNSWIVNIFNDFLGYTSVIAGGVGNSAGQYYLSRTVPQDNPDDRMLSAFDVHLKMDVVKGQDLAGLALPDEAIATVRYKDTLYQILSDDELLETPGNTGLNEWSLLRYVVGDLQTSGYYQTIPANGGALHWEIGRGGWQSGSATEEVAACTAKRGTILPEGDLTIVWMNVPYRCIPWAAIKSLIGKSNAQALGGPPSVVPFCDVGSLVMLEPKIRSYNQLWQFGDPGAIPYLMCDIKYCFRHYPQTIPWVPPTLETGVKVVAAPGFPALPAVTILLGGANCFWRWNGPAIAGQPAGARFELAWFGPKSTGNAGTGGVDFINPSQLLFPLADYRPLFVPVGP